VRSQFDPLSLIVGADFASFPISTKVVHHPAGFRPAESRILFHETVHFWQQMGQGYLLLRVDEDWRRLQEFLDTGKALSPGGMKAHFSRVPDDISFSPRDLHESLARFWDMHVLGPDKVLELEIESGRRAIDPGLIERFHDAQAAGMIRHPVHGGYSDLAYDLAMEAAAGNYGVPYLLLRHQVSPIFAGTVFPLAGHMAFKSRDPVRRFRRIVDVLAGGAFPDVEPGRSVNELWEAHYLLVCSVAREIAESEDEPPIETIDALGSGILDGHPVYAWARRSLVRMARALGWCDFEPSFLNEMQKKIGALPAEVAGFLKLDFILASPGNPMSRRLLVEWLAPPVVRFSDGELWELGRLAEQEREDVPLELSQDPDHWHDGVTDSALAIAARWREFRRAARGF
jgi:hypothetical protein